MPRPAPAASLRAIPSVDQLVGRPALVEMAGEFGRACVVECAREVLSEVRGEIRGGEAPEGVLSGLEERVAGRVRREMAPSLSGVINATGVILHTNLGRAPLSRAAVERVAAVAASYTNLEYDLETGGRGKRDVHAARLLKRLLGDGTAAVVVNNNAAAVLLVLNTLAEGGEVVVSRGELIEIGGSFRIPDVMVKSGSMLREVGTTNRTRLADYEAAINEHTRLLLRVHPSNYRIVGFTERASLEDLVELGRRRGVPVFEDLGSGCLLDLRPYGITDEPVVAASLAAGVDIICFSGDKLLGGPQAGIIAGKPEVVERVRRNPLFRALRVDKLTYAALEATLDAYLRGRPDDLPVARMIRVTPDEMDARARAFASALAEAMAPPFAVGVAAGRSVVGGGSTPGQFLPTTLVTVTHRSLDPAVLEAHLRTARPPVIARVDEGRLLLDLRTVFPEQEAALRSALESLGALEP